MRQCEQLVLIRHEGIAASDFPYLSETARSARSIPSDEEFRRGFALVLDGLDRARRRQRQVERG